jgi:uncharacterized protein YdiU (UPF0061 family)
MLDTSVDYTIFFRELSSIPEDIGVLTKSFYGDAIFDEDIRMRWKNWLRQWRDAIAVDLQEDLKELSEHMKQVNPKYTLREWFLVPAYQKAQEGDCSFVHELQEVMKQPYDELSKEIEEKYYRQKPAELFKRAGVSHVSCSS